MTSPSLTSYVELFFINSICGTSRNQIDIFGFSDKPLRALVYIKSLIPSDYTPYIATILTNTVKLSNASYVDPVLKNTTYFLVGTDVDCSSPRRLYQLYTQSGGTNLIGSNYAPSVEYRYRLAMPSRGKLFR